MNAHEFLIFVRRARAIDVRVARPVPIFLDTLPIQALLAGVAVVI